MGNVVKLAILLILLSYYDATKIGLQKRSTTGSWILNSIKTNSKNIANKLINLSLKRVDSSCTLGISNKMSQRDLVNPRLYLANGYALSPPPLTIQTSAANGGITKVVFLEASPVGVLCYECRTDNMQGNEFQKRMACMYFNAEKKTFGYKSVIIPLLIDEKYLHDIYMLFDQNQQIPSAATIGKFHYVEDNDLKVAVYAQMTTSKNARLVFEIYDSAPNTNTYKRELSTLAVTGISLLTSLASAFASAGLGLITAEQGTILTLENESTLDDPIILEDPMWHLDGVIVEDIIPRNLTAKQTSHITVVAPFAKAQKRQLPSTATSVFVLSFRVQGFRNRIVLAIWWPRKLMPNEKVNSYALSWLTPEETANTNLVVAKELENVASAIKSFPQNEKDANSFLTPLQNFVSNMESKKMPYTQVQAYQHYFYWKFPLLNPSTVNEEKKVLKILTWMGSGRKSGMVMKIYGMTVNQDTSFNLAIPSPKPYQDSAEQNPPKENS